MSKAKLFVVVMLLVIVSSLLVAYSSRGNDTSSATERPTVAQAPEVVTNAHAPGILPNMDANRRWSGEVFLSDNGFPDLRRQARISPKQGGVPDCISFDSNNSSRRHGGCVE